MPEILFVAGRDPRDEPGGGHSCYVRAYARAALRAGFLPRIFCVGRSAEVARTDYGVIHRVESPGRPFRQLMIPVHGPLLARAVAAFASESGARLFHGFGVWGWAAVAARQRLKKRGIAARALVSSYTTYEDESRSKVDGLSDIHTRREQLRFRAEHAWSRLSVVPFERRAYRSADLLLLNYDSVRRLVEKKYGSAPRCRKIAYTSEQAFLHETVGSPPLPPPFLEVLGPPTAPLVVSVSRHDPRKGVDVLLAALAGLKKRGVPFRACIAGEGTLLETHRRLAVRSGLDGSTLVAGFVPDVWSLLAHADVFVLPSRREQSGSLALLEALQAGVAVVASSCDGIPEDVTDGEDALLPPPGNAAALEGALSRLLRDEALRRRLARRAHETFEKRFSPDVFSRDLGAVYREMGEP